ncbi:MAG: undecaprenyl-diphosphate phosphatase [Pseudomonadota bacterium]
MSAYLAALILGIIEGLTEFLPVSSTGHLILAAELMGVHDEKGKLFEVVIQLGAILAICWEYRARLSGVIRGLPSDPAAQRFAVNVLIAFLPAAMLGALFIGPIKDVLFQTPIVAAAWILGGVFILWTERRPHVVRIHGVEEMRTRDALRVGLAQTVALIPGVSRSGATIIGGLWFGLSRRAATEFSFFLAIPTMFAATLYDLYKHGGLLSIEDLGPFTVGFLAAFASAFIAVRALLRYIQNHDFTLFAWYRIVFGVLILFLA